MPRQYRNPPLVEAACEFRFNSERPWDWTIPGLIYERIGGEFPEKRQQTGIGFEFTLGPGQPTVTPPVAQSVNKMQFVREDKTALVQVGPNLLAVNQLQPYPQWEAYRRRILEQLATYREVAAPDGFARIGLRYINKVNLPGGGIELKDYFRTLPELPEEIPQNWSAFVMSVNVTHTDPDSTLRVSVATAPPEAPDTFLVVLDLDLFGEGDGLPDLDHAEEWLNTAHDRIEEAFDVSVTPKSHEEVFGEVKAAKEANG